LRPIKDSGCPLNSTITSPELTYCTMSFTTLHGPAVLENPRVIQKTKTVVFDGQLFLPSTEPALIRSFRYYNETNLHFADVGCYSLNIRVSPPSFR
jgi:hypothetical protein